MANPEVDLTNAADIRRHQTAQSRVVDSSRAGLSGEEQQRQHQAKLRQLEFERTGVMPEEYKSSGDDQNAGDWTTTGDGTGYPATPKAAVEEAPPEEPPLRSRQGRPPPAPPVKAAPAKKNEPPPKGKSSKSTPYPKRGSR